VLRTFVAAPKSAESLEQNVAFATEEFELDALDRKRSSSTPVFGLDDQTCA
jgi:hypothetical protein